MAVYCSKCGKQHPDDANFCMGCGQSLKAGGHSPSAMRSQWEYKDVIIQFPRDKFRDINVDNHKQYQEVVRLADTMILARIQQEGKQGWQPEGSTDFRTLDQLDIIQKRKRVVLALTMNAERVTYEQVTIRLKRLVP